MSSHLSWHIDAWGDYLYWQKNDKKILRKLNELIKETLRKPFSGIGKPAATLYKTLKMGKYFFTL